MKKLFFFLSLICTWSVGFGQHTFKVNGGHLKLTGNIKLVLNETDFSNTNGTLSATNGKIFFTGNTDNTITSGGAIFSNLTLNKNTGKKLILKDDLLLADTLSFGGNGNWIEIDSSNLTLDTTATISAANPTNYIITDSTGQVIKKGLTTFIFPVGANSITYNPVTLVESGTRDDIGVRVLPDLYTNGNSGNPMMEGVVAASWVLTEATPGGSNLSMTTQWSASDELSNFNRTDSGIADYENNDWDLPFAEAGAASGSDPYTHTRTGLSAGIYGVGGEVLLNHVQLEARIFLQGAYSTASSNMRDDLRSAAYIPTAEPYNAMAGFTHTGRGGDEMVSSATIFDQPGTADDVVDWVMVELIDKNNPNTVLESKSALLQRDGDIVDVDGISPLGIPVADDQYYLKIRHRNHLGVRSTGTLSLSETSSTSYDFTTASSQANGVNPMAEPSAGVFALWGGNAKSDDNYVRVTPRVFPPPSLSSDRTYILDVILSGDPNAMITGYSNGDTNMDGNVRVTPRVFPPPAISSDATFILDNVLGGDPNATRTEQ